MSTLPIPLCAKHQPPPVNSTLNTLQLWHFLQCCCTAINEYAKMQHSSFDELPPDHNMMLIMLSVA
jgi:hypothetical protein